jgi:hypothetical protein
MARQDPPIGKQANDEQNSGFSLRRFWLSLPEFSKE